MTLPESLTLALLDQLPEALAVLDVREEGLPVVLANQPLAALRGRARGELVQLGLAGLLGELPGAARVTEVAAVLARAEPLTLRVAAESPRGPATLELRFEALRDAAGVATHVVCFHAQVPGAPPREAEPAIRPPLPREDRLTGLRHIEFFHELYRRDFAIAQREGRALTIFLADIDALGVYNETFGRQAGDSVVRRVGRALASGLRRASDLVARVEAGRFVGLTVGMDLAESRRHGETLAARVRELHMHHPHSPVAKVVTVSIGVGHLVPAPAATAEQLLRAAQRALESARESGRNRVAVDG
ncbi:MAG: GGDEF domain-containing protein [Proteobacteria bacterium]|nr:GGDEF domain-containing protein [Pseudomonadota bacterium]